MFTVQKPLSHPFRRFPVGSTVSEDDLKDCVLSIADLEASGTIEKVKDEPKDEKKKT
jgi:hypothetical protein